MVQGSCLHRAGLSTGSRRGVRKRPAFQACPDHDDGYQREGDIRRKGEMNAGQKIGANSHHGGEARDPYLLSGGSGCLMWREGPTKAVSGADKLLAGVKPSRFVAAQGIRSGSACGAASELFGERERIKRRYIESPAGHRRG
jgi:hypothetical protein